MSKLTLSLAAASFSLLASWGSAQAQTYMYEDEAESPAVIVEPAPRVYGYYYYDEHGDAADRTPVIELQRPPGVPGGCGEYFFWNGAQCVDARNKP